MFNVEVEIRVNLGSLCRSIFLPADTIALVIFIASELMLTILCTNQAR